MIMHRVLIIGPQGVGKSTQGKLLQEFLQVPYISSGDVLRQKAEEQSYSGERLKNLLQTGQLVPDEQTADLLQERLLEKDCQNGFIVDGYPRTVNQLKIFDPQFSQVIYLVASDEIVTERLVGRGREDDTAEVIAKRLKIYHQWTEPIVDYFQEKHLLHLVDGTGTVEKIQNQIRKIFEQ